MKTEVPTVDFWLHLITSDNKRPGAPTYAEINAPLGKERGLLMLTKGHTGNVSTR